MRRFIAFFTSCLMAFSFSANILAANITSNGGAELAPIKVSYELTTSDAEEVYYVDVTWGSFENTYKTNDVKVWNPETLMYEIESGVPEWTCANGANTVNITNHSNTEVTALISYTPNPLYSGVAGAFDKGVISLDAPAEGSVYESAPKDSATLTLSGTLDSSQGTRVEVGTVSISLVGEPVGNISFANSSAAYPIFKQADGIYFASFTAIEDTEEQDTYIEINNETYYIAEEHNYDDAKVFCFRTGMTVKLGLSKPDMFKKMTELFEGRSYTLVLDFTDPQNPTATLNENN